MSASIDESRSSPDSAIRADFVQLCRAWAPQVIYECGSRDARDGVELARAVGARELHVFECNPPAVALCRKTLESDRSGLQWQLVPMAVADRSGSLKFRQVVPEFSQTSLPDGNIGGSSVFTLNPDYPGERLVQNEITVNSIALDDYAATHAPPDLLWMDLQGAERMVLAGATSVLRHVKVIHLEVMFRPVYLGQPLFCEIDRLLRRDFRLVRVYGPRTWWKRVLLRANRHVAWGHWLGVGPWFRDAVYVRKPSVPGNT
jgi:FkbM family methyltransferase